MCAPASLSPPPQSPPIPPPPSSCRCRCRCRRHHIRLFHRPGVPVQHGGREGGGMVLPARLQAAHSPIHLLAARREPVHVPRPQVPRLLDAPTAARHVRLHGFGTTRAQLGTCVPHTHTPTATSAARHAAAVAVVVLLLAAAVATAAFEPWRLSHTHARVRRRLLILRGASFVFFTWCVCACVVTLARCWTTRPCSTF
jgi:hypothetical protein